MKRLLLMIGTAVVIGLLAYGVTYHCRTSTCSQLLKGDDPGLEWLRREYQLSDVQYEKIKELHRSFRPLCQTMCDRIGESQQKLGRLMNEGQTVTPEMDLCLKELEGLNTECRRHTLVHFYQVASVMEPEHGKRYLQKMQAHLVRGGARGMHERIESQSCH